MAVRVPNQDQQQFSDWFEELISKCDDEWASSLLCSIAWAIWLRRNRKVFNDYLLSVDQTLQVALSMGLAIDSVNNVNDGEAVPVTWQRPSQGIIKINFDAAYSNERGAGYGMVARDNDGLLLAAATYYAGPALDSMLAEAACMRWSMNLCKDLGFQSLVLETNCLLLHQAWSAKSVPHSYVGVLFQDCRLLASSFSILSMCHEKCQCNQAADFMSKLAYSMQDNVWIEDGPPGLNTILSADLFSFCYELMNVMLCCCQFFFYHAGSKL